MEGNTQIGLAVDPAGKARHCVLMMLAASSLAGMAAVDHQQRALGRYVFLWADALGLWLGRWRNQLKRNRATARFAAQVEPQVRRLQHLVERHSPVRDYLAAKRQALHADRAMDLEETLLLYRSITAGAVRELMEAAVQAYDALAATGRIAEVSVVAPGLPGRVQVVLGSNTDAGLYFAADTYALARDGTFPVGQGGQLGRRIAQINDLASHLDVVLPLVPAVHGHLPVDWLVRSALLVELSALLDLSIGPPPSVKPSWQHRPLLEICRAGRAETGAHELQRLREAIAEEGWEYLRWSRNRVGAHADGSLSIFEIHQHLIELDVHGIVRLAEFALNWLDAVGCAELDLKLLLFRARVRGDAERLDQSARGVGTIGAGLAQFDSPHVIFSGGGTFSGPTVAGMLAGRRPRPRKPVEVPPRPDRWPTPIRNLDVDDVLARAKSAHGQAEEPEGPKPE